MGTFIMGYGKLTIPDSKKAEFLSDAKKVLYQAGLILMVMKQISHIVILRIHSGKMQELTLKT